MLLKCDYLGKNSVYPIIFVLNNFVEIMSLKHSCNKHTYFIINQQVVTRIFLYLFVVLRNII